MGDTQESATKTSQVVIKYLLEKTLDAPEEKARLFTNKGLLQGTTVDNREEDIQSPYLG